MERVILAYDIAELPLGKTHYEMGGDGPLIVLVHGVSTPSMAYDNLQPLLWEAGFSTLRYDLFGRGGSDAKNSFAYDAALYSQQLIELLDHLGIEGPQHLMGYSMGGGVIACFADSHPERVKSLTFIASSGFVTGAGDIFPLFRTKILGPFLFEAFGGSALRAAVIKDGKENDVPRAFYMRQVRETRKPGYMRALRKSTQVGPLVGLTETHQRLAAHQFPTLALWAKDDTVILLDSKERFEQASHAGVISEVIDNAGHAIAYTHHDEIAPRIVKFLNTGT